MLLLVLLILAISAPFLWRAWIEGRYSPAIYSASNVRTERVAIVFGARVYNNGRLSGMLRDRVDMAVELYKAGKVNKLLVSGDNQFIDYDEPSAMMNYAIAQGVPASDIQPDFGGRRTYDTCYRAKSIFQVDSAILVTQQFHLPRALFLCEQLGIDAVGVAADKRIYDPRSIAFSETRELPATLAALIDVIRKAPPPVMGDPIPIE
ncbi:MAG: ElyC/SanA/YdcF family protein [Caldilineaceae bacterium]